MIPGFDGKNVKFVDDRMCGCARRKGPVVVPTRHGI
jgi:hypothetical protein